MEDLFRRGFLERFSGCAATSVGFVLRVIGAFAEGFVFRSAAKGNSRFGRLDRFNRGDRPGRGGSDSRFQRSAPSSRVGRDYDYGPPPGYQPIVLPGESISKYQR